jgi:hypothetical protein
LSANPGPRKDPLPGTGALGEEGVLSKNSGTKSSAQLLRQGKTAHETNPETSFYLHCFYNSFFNRLSISSGEQSGSVHLPSEQTLGAGCDAE